MTEPGPILTDVPKMPGLDGEKMSKSYDNVISLREEPLEIESKIRKMMTDPARVRLKDPGNPSNCPVYDLHQVYSSEDTKSWVRNGCTNASIGCIDCKKPLIDSINTEQQIMIERAQQFEEDPDLVHSIIQEGSEQARLVARDTLDEVKECIGISHR